MIECHQFEQKSFKTSLIELVFEFGVYSYTIKGTRNREFEKSSPRDEEICLFFLFFLSHFLFFVFKKP